MTAKFIDPSVQYRDALESARKKFKLGARVFFRRCTTRNGTTFGGIAGTVISLPGDSSLIAQHLVGVRSDDGTTHGVDPSLLVLCD